ncbi:hypothetical protein LTR85_001371 [Meristemomyces frigidus]|nr:hypothetical protein LTR85_001371 [Meristemomyces frigidus]
MPKSRSTADASLDALREISSTFKSVKLSLDQTNDRLGSIESHHKHLAADGATLLGDRHVQNLLQPGTVDTLRVRQFARDNPASDRLLATTELLELILLNLPMRDLLFAQRVSTRFKRVIDKSSPIQQALFFEPEAAGPNGIPPHGYKTNPLLGDGSRIIRPPGPGPMVFNEDGEGFAIKIDRSASNMPTRSGSPDGFWKIECTLTDVSARSIYEVYRYFREGSRRRMYATQPPCPVIVRGGIYGAPLSLGARSASASCGNQVAMARGRPSIAA